MNYIYIRSTRDSENIQETRSFVVEDHVVSLVSMLSSRRLCNVMTNEFSPSSNVNLALNLESSRSIRL